MNYRSLVVRTLIDGQYVELGCVEDVWEKIFDFLDAEFNVAKRGMRLRVWTRKHKYLIVPIHEKYAGWHIGEVSSYTRSWEWISKPEKLTNGIIQKIIDKNY